MWIVFTVMMSLVAVIMGLGLLMFMAGFFGLMVMAFFLSFRVGVTGRLVGKLASSSL